MKYKKHSDDKKIAIFFVKDLIFKKKCSITLLGG